MTGAVFAIGIVGIALIVISGLAWFFVIPVLIIMGAVFFLAPMLGALGEGKTGAEPGPTGTTSTRDASYEPRTNA